MYLGKIFHTKKTRNEIKFLNKIFKENKIKALLFKDMGWLPIYKSMHLTRTCYDIDLLIRPEDNVKATALVEKNGWELKERNEKFVKKEGYQRFENQFYNKKSGVTLEFQYDPALLYRNYKLLPALKSLTDHIFKTTPGIGAIRPEKHIQLILAALHFYFHDQCFGIRHAFEIKNLADIMTPSDWVTTHKVVKLMRVNKYFWIALLLVEKLMGRKVIPDFSRKLISKKDEIVAYFFTMTRNQTIREEKSKYSPSKYNFLFRLFDL